MKKAFIFGDSNTYGYDPREFSDERYPEEERWTTILQKQLKDSWELIPDGLNGRRIPDSDGKMMHLERMFREYQPFDLFICMLGTNDILQTLSPDAEEAAEKMEKFLIWLKKRNAAPDILLIAPAPIGETGDVFYQRCHRECLRMNQLFREAAKRQQVRFADAAQWDIRLAYDQVHFSPEGCKSFAARILEMIPH